MAEDMVYNPATGEFLNLFVKQYCETIEGNSMEGLTPISNQEGGVQKSAPRNPKVYLGIAHGRVTHKNRETGETDLYDNVTGTVTEIRERDAEFNGKAVAFFDIALSSGDTDYILSVNRDSGVARSLVNSLASLQDFSKPVVVKPWETDPDDNGRTYTNVNVYVESISKENKLPWAIELPKVRYQQVGRNRVADDTERFNAIQGLVGSINARVKGSSD